MTSPDGYPMTPTEIAAIARARREKEQIRVHLHLERLARLEAQAYHAIKGDRGNEIDESPF